MAKPPKPPFHDWNFLSLHFRHQYEMGFRYLDHCGEFMVRLVRDFDFIANDATPTGAKLNQPDIGVHLDLDAAGLALRQEVPPDHGEQFFDLVNEVAAMTSELIRPEAIFYAGFAANLYKPFSTEAQVYAASLETRPIFDFKLADNLGMDPLHQAVSYLFHSGSYDLQVNCKPVTFNAVKKETQRSYGFRPTDIQKQRIDRLNAREESRSTPNGYALMLEADLREWNPPPNALHEQFAELQKRLEILCREF